MSVKPLQRLILLSLLALGVLPDAASASQVAFNEVAISAIKSIRFWHDRDRYHADVVIHMRNGNPYAVSMRKVAFKVTFHGVKPGPPPLQTSVSLGSATLPEIQLQPVLTAAATSPAITPVHFTLDVGPRTEKTVERMIDAFNLLGDPDFAFKMSFVGPVEAGVQVEHGWVWQKVEPELTFVPNVQREVLLE